MIKWNIRTGRAEAVAEFFSLPADDDEAERADEREEMPDDADERREMREELRIEHDRDIDNDVRRAEADYLYTR